MAEYTPLAFEINLRAGGLVFDVRSLFEAFCGLVDQRDGRGVRAALTTILTYTVVAKLAGENHLLGMAQWVQVQATELSDLLGLTPPQAPNETTYSRILSRAVPLLEFQQLVRDFFARQPQTGQTAHIALDTAPLTGLDGNSHLGYRLRSHLLVPHYSRRCAYGSLHGSDSVLSHLCWRTLGRIGLDSDAVSHSRRGSDRQRGR